MYQITYNHSEYGNDITKEKTIKEVKETIENLKKEGYDDFRIWKEIDLNTERVMYKSLEQQIAELWGSRGMKPVIEFHAEEGRGIWTITSPVPTEHLEYENTIKTLKELQNENIRLIKKEAKLTKELEKLKNK